MQAAGLAVLSADLSAGVERFPIRCVGDPALCGAPGGFEYIVDNETCVSVRSLPTLLVAEGCACVANRRCGAECPCGEHRECCFLCECAADCPRRVLQRGLSQPLEVFFTGAARGFGVRTLAPIAAGAFVCEYVAELRTGAQQQRHRLQQQQQQQLAMAHVALGNYVLFVQEFRAASTAISSSVTSSSSSSSSTSSPSRGDTEGSISQRRPDVFCLDATRRGNVARFVNHSCAPNLCARVLRIDTRLPHVGLFAARAIAAAEELTFSYGAAPRPPPSADVPRVRCACGSEACAGFLPYEPDVE